MNPIVLNQLKENLRLCEQNKAKIVIITGAGEKARNGSVP